MASSAPSSYTNAFVSAYLTLEWGSWQDASPTKSGHAVF